MRRLEAAAWAAVEAQFLADDAWMAGYTDAGRPTRAAAGRRAGPQRAAVAVPAPPPVPATAPAAAPAPALPRGEPLHEGPVPASAWASRPSTRSRPRASPTRTWTAPSSSRASRPSRAWRASTTRRAGGALRRRRGVAVGARPLRARTSRRLRRARRGHARAGPRERRRGDGRRRQLGERGQGRAGGYDRDGAVGLFPRGRARCRGCPGWWWQGFALLPVPFRSPLVLGCVTSVAGRARRHSAICV